MESIFLSIYRFFHSRKGTFWLAFIALIGLMSFGASRITIEEDITRFFPDDERVEKLNYVFKNSKLAERIVFMVSMRDSASKPSPDSLVAYAELLIPKLDANLAPYVKSITAQVDDSKIMEVVSLIQDNLPLFLEESDYSKIDSMLQPDVISHSLEQSYRQLISPTGMVTKRIVIKDPIGFSYLALNKLRQLQYENQVEVYNGYLISKDHRHLIFFAEPKFKSSDTGKNTPLVKAIQSSIDEAGFNPLIKASYFGGTVVAAGNAIQLQRDTILTVSLTIVLLIVFLIGFFRRKRIPFLILIPAMFGGLFALSAVCVLQGSISVIAIAGGSIILGIAVNYSLHFFTHLKHVGDKEETLKDLVKPMTIGSATTVLAFFCLQFVNASVLRDLGLFAGFSLVGAALCTLIFLPHLISTTVIQRSRDGMSWLDKAASVSFEDKKYLLIVILVLTPLFLYFANDVKFNTDLSQLNYMSEELAMSQKRLESINSSSLTSLYVISQSTSLEKALRKNEVTSDKLKQLQKAGLVQKHASISSFLISDSLQQIRIRQWNQFWTETRKESLTRSVHKEGQKFNFSDQIYSNVDSLLNRKYTSGDSSIQSVFRSAFFDDYIIEKDGLATVVTLANVAPENKGTVYHQLNETPSHSFDRLMLTNLFVEYVHADFNFIVAFTSILVFCALLISYGRIELTMITFIPMLITWIWILGIMALVGIEFNIVNVMISTFIFGLGDDYSIFTMDGLLTEYRSGKKNLPSIRTSILLSALTTISGLGVLIFAEHPALRSIAVISIIGIVCVFVMSQTIEPFLFRWLITDRVSKGKPPMTFLGMIRTFFLYSFFVVGSLILTSIGLVLKLAPVGRKRVKLFYHSLIRFYTKSLVSLDPQVRIRTINQSDSVFSSPSVIISNHSSFLDILFTVMQSPKVVLLTNKWVWNSPVFGGVVRLAGYYPVTDGAEDSIDKLRTAVDDGYSIVVFPEGTRTTDGNLKRFHKGAFYLAETLQIPIQPLLIKGAGEAVPKGDFYVNPVHIVLKYLPAISANDNRFGSTYSEKTKQISRYFKDEYVKLTTDELTPQSCIPKLHSNYLYKGPILEWYMRVKVRLEKNYEPFHLLVPKKAKVLDLGCGYGFMSYMLALLSPDREVTGIDYDDGKIEVAQHGYLRPGNLAFERGDITQVSVDGYDTVIIADVLHYLTALTQKETLLRFFSQLKPGGKIIIREGNADLKERHFGTQLTEFFSVRLLRFNKSANTLHFISGRELTTWASDYGLRVTIVDDTRLTSNVIFVISKLD